ncbi:MAG: response regulator [Actinomycetota bacterium]|nr:response regulator [Actinomycetota bacterium]
MDQGLKGSRILAVDDSDANLLVLSSILEDIGYDNVLTLSDAAKAVATCEAFDPDLLLLDLHMPGVSGLDVMAAVREATSDTYLPILMLTADASSEAKVRALSTGANDFLTKPFDRTEVELRIKNLLHTRHLHLALRSQNALLEQRVAERTHQLEATKFEILDRLAMAAEFRDDQTGQHTKRVGRSAALIGEALALPPKLIEGIRRAAPLHDVGKIGVADSILLKNGPLTPAERELMKQHTAIGAKLLANSDSMTLQLAERIAATHHERWDGTGYGSKLAGEHIPICGRIVAVADVFDALTHDRPYKKAWPLDQAIDEIREQRGRQFDPKVIDAFLDVQQDVDLSSTGEVEKHLIG